jgi:hypothetical protein
VDEERRNPALLKIREVAGGLPPGLPAVLRLSVFIEWAWERLAARPMRLLAIYAMIVLGTSLGSGLQVYLTYRLPSYMDIERFTISMERGLFLGILFGLGIFVTRLVVELFPEIHSIPRIIASTLLGGLLLSIALFLYDALFLSTAPSGLLFVAGCFWIAFGQALGSLNRSPIIKIIFSFGSIFTAIAGSWFGHVLLTDSPFNMTPIFFYEYTWEPLQVLAVILIAALPIAIIGNIPRISPTK